MSPGLKCARFPQWLLPTSASESTSPEPLSALNGLDLLRWSACCCNNLALPGKFLCIGAHIQQVTQLRVCGFRPTTCLTSGRACATSNVRMRNAFSCAEVLFTPTIERARSSQRAPLFRPPLTRACTHTHTHSTTRTFNIPRLLSLDELWMCLPPFPGEPQRRQRVMLMRL